jgi:hypothetical protein
MIRHHLVKTSAFLPLLLAIGVVALASRARADAVQTVGITIQSFTVFAAGGEVALEVLPPSAPGELPAPVSGEGTCVWTLTTNVVTTIQARISTGILPDELTLAVETRDAGHVMSKGPVALCNGADPVAISKASPECFTGGGTQRYTVTATSATPPPMEGLPIVVELTII